MKHQEKGNNLNDTTILSQSSTLPRFEFDSQLKSAEFKQRTRHTATISDASAQRSLKRFESLETSEEKKLKPIMVYQTNPNNQHVTSVRHIMPTVNLSMINKQTISSEKLTP